MVVTGLGAITPLGNDIQSTWDGMIAGRSGYGPITLFDPSPFAVQIAGEIRNFDPLQWVERKDARRMDRNTMFAVAASRQAVDDAKLTIDASNAESIGALIGTAIGGIRMTVDQQKILDEKGPNRLSPFFLQNLIPDAASGQVAISLGVKGPNLAIVSACATGGHTLGEAAETIRRGDAVAMIAGGTESCVIPLVLAGFIVMRALASGNGNPQTACRPFDRNRSGFVMAEGAAAMVLEDLDHARTRGARIYAELVGYGSSNDAFDLAAPADKGEGIARAMSMALRKAKASPTDVDYINAHGTGTLLNDKFETAGVRSVFGEHADRLVMSSTKSMTGHMMGAAGLVEGTACVLSIVHGIVPPTINYQVPDPECDIDCAPNVARSMPVRMAMSNSMGLGGHNSCVIFRAFDEN
uniref:3-oxoacyl-[acyl-carrier-protein] synthase 2 n=1 Tax=uncultured bacterium F25-01 TaxID=1191433 RepID=I3VIH8_9BACT|nr:3-oxoacyl-[acyl-carrier-protein] synthase KASII [uncultured bacterium F25-01]